MFFLIYYSYLVLYLLVSLLHNTLRGVYFFLVSPYKSSKLAESFWEKYFYIYFPVLGLAVQSNYWLKLQYVTNKYIYNSATRTNITLSNYFHVYRFIKLNASNVRGSDISLLINYIVTILTNVGPLLSVKITKNVTLVILSVSVFVFKLTNKVFNININSDLSSFYHAINTKKLHYTQTAARSVKFQFVNVAYVLRNLVNFNTPQQRVSDSLKSHLSVFWSTRFKPTTTTFFSKLNTNIFFLRKMKVLNKGRYSRSRQLSRVLVYWLLWFGVIVMYGYYFAYYRYTYNFSYYWWLYYGLFSSFFFHTVVKYRFYNFNVILLELSAAYSWFILIFVNIFTTIQIYLKKIFLKLHKLIFFYLYFLNTRLLPKNFDKNFEILSTQDYFWLVDFNTNLKNSTFYRLLKTLI